MRGAGRGPKGPEGGGAGVEVGAQEGGLQEGGRAQGWDEADGDRKEREIGGD